MFAISYAIRLNVLLNIQLFYRQEYIAYDNNGVMQPFSELSPLTVTSCTREDFCLRYITPVMKVRLARENIE